MFRNRYKSFCIYLYEKYGNCAETARQMNRSALTVARYIRGGKDTPQILKHTTRQTIGK